MKFTLDLLKKDCQPSKGSRVQRASPSETYASKARVPILRVST